MASTNAERSAERNPAEEMLNALRAAVDLLGQEIRVKAAVGRLVDVVGEEEREHEQGRRPQVRHERHQGETEADRADRDEHERTAAAERRVERVAPRADHERQRQGEDALGGEHRPDQRGRRCVLAEHRRQVGGRRRQRPRQAERADAQLDDRPDARAELSDRRRRGR